jgi:LacI family transcriptional regulator
LNTLYNKIDYVNDYAIDLLKISIFSSLEVFLVTIVDVAKRSGVSAATVSHVLNGTRFVSMSVKQRVLEAVEELGYQPNSLARSLRKKETQSLGLVLPDSVNQYFAEIFSGVEKAAYDKGYSVILCNTEGDETREKLYINVLRNKQVDGILFVSAGDHAQTFQFLLENKIPVALVDRDLPDLEIDTVTADNFQGGYLATKHLISLGHKRIACITGPAGIVPSGRRIAGYRNALEEEDIRFDEQLICAGNFHAESGKLAASHLFESNPPSAIFAFNDLMAVGAIRAAAESKRNIPTDLALVGFDDIELSSFIQPSLTTIRQPKQEMGRLAVEMLISRIADPNTPIKKITLPVSIIKRESCGGNN